MKGLTILAVGVKHDPELASAIERYEARLKKVLPVTWRFVAYSSESDTISRRIESRSLLDKLLSDDFVVLLDETGSQLSSESFSDMLLRGIERPTGRLVFIIGGSYGVDETIMQRADYVLSLSKLVFPHQLVRVLLVEQLYRAWTIQQNHPYHHR